ncbi:VOC family protein [Desulfonatronum lacustre]|uniref:VOC family protein n=1 Tax=Desulfonatronum lacustre TaxID=66849 RepID=UPI0004B0F21E|nr:VOC family protein [Desulfonatronum lacustre]
MFRCGIDHIAVTAPSLESGARYVLETLGVEPRAGGEHPRMGTHNLLLRLGEALYLEVIAPDPRAPKPKRPRWFGLDDLRPDASPKLSTWVARTTDIRATTVACTEDLGTIEPMSRGRLQWLITIPTTGRTPLDGVAPALIEWPVSVHPATSLTDFGLSLVELRLIHPDPARINRLLESMNFEGPLTVSTPSDDETAHLLAVVDTPQGRRLLSTPGPRL